MGHVLQGEKRRIGSTLDAPLMTSATPKLDVLTTRMSRARTVPEVLDALDAFSMRLLPLHVLGAARLPVNVSDWQTTQLGKDAFLHESVPAGWWEEYRTTSLREYDPGLMMARSSLMAYTLTETMQMLDPIGIDRWSFELFRKYGIRDALVCSVGRRWMVTYWSAKPLGVVLLTPSMRILLFAAASFAALRLEQMVERDVRPTGKRARATPRELAVLRLLSMGRQVAEIATVLGLGEETVRSHLKKVQAKLGVRNRPHAVAEAIRQHLIP